MNPNKKILTKDDIEKMANEVIEYLIKHSLFDTCVYYNNKRISVDYDYKNDEPNLKNEDDISPLNYFEYAATKHILSMSFEGALYDSFNYHSDYTHIEKLEEIFNKYGVCHELGHSWNLTVYPLNDDLEVEYTDYTSMKEPEPIYINFFDNECHAPIELFVIQRCWFELSMLVGNEGSCVINAGFRFKYHNIPYFMPPMSPYQGSISWEKHKDKIEKLLISCGAIDIVYDYGRMD